ncbi:MAG: recombinase family protein, partial [Candidatus Ornithomonoglobus sp.]
LCEWLAGYRLQWELPSEDKKPISQVDIKRRALQKAEKELDTLNKQVDRAHDLLEQGVYDTDTFLSRSKSLTERINQAHSNIESLRSELETEIIREESSVNIIPSVEHLLEVYDELPSAKAKNDLLKEVLEKVVYNKTERAQRGGPLDNFELTIYPKIPHSPPSDKEQT